MMTLTNLNALMKAKRNRDTAGFTLIEVMMALLIMVLLTAIVANGIPVAYHAYLKAVKASNAQVALSTTITELRNELGSAETGGPFQPVTDSSSVVQRFYVDGHWMVLRNANTADEENGLMIGACDSGHSTINGSVVLNEPSKYVPLVPKSAISGNEKPDEKLIVKYDSVTYSNGVFSVNNLRVVDENDATLATAGVDESGTYHFMIRAVLN